MKSSVFSALAAARLDRLLLRSCVRGDRALILNFHRISPQSNPYWPSVAPEQFDRLVGHLVATCDVTGLRELARSSASGRPRVVLSFDDGYRDFIEYAMPILEHHQVRANQNIVAQSVETGQPPWMTRVVDALDAVGPERVRALSVPGFNVRLQGDDELSKVAYGTQLTAYLKGLHPASHPRVSVELDALMSETGRQAAMMSSAEVQETAGVHEIGAHSYGHHAMALMDDEEFAADLKRCEQLFSKLRLPMDIYAFPYGSFRSEQISTLQGHGVEHVLLIGQRPARIGSGVYSRISMYGDSDAELRLRAAGFAIRRPALAR